MEVTTNHRHRKFADGFAAFIKIWIYYRISMTRRFTRVTAYPKYFINNQMLVVWAHNPRAGCLTRVGFAAVRQA
jgi:hypothetical protein